MGDTICVGLNGMLFHTERAMCEFYGIPYLFYIAKKAEGLSLQKILECYRDSIR